MRYFDHHSNDNERLYRHSRRVPTADNLEDFTFLGFTTVLDFILGDDVAAVGRW